MKATIKLSESREEDRTIHRRGGDLSLLWISILAVLFYLASIIAALAEEPLVPDNGLKSVSMTSSPATPKPRQSWLRRLFYRPTWSEVLEQCILKRFARKKPELIELNRRAFAAGRAASAHAAATESA